MAPSRNREGTMLGNKIDIAGKASENVTPGESKGQVYGLGQSVDPHQFDSLVEGVEPSKGAILGLGNDAGINWTPAKSDYSGVPVLPSERSPSSRK